MKSVNYNHSCISVEEIVVGGSKDLSYVHIHTTVVGPMESQDSGMFCRRKYAPLPVIGPNMSMRLDKDPQELEAYNVTMRRIPFAFAAATILSVDVVLKCSSTAN